ncbi:unnamed protein product [Eruca vesicaria subsp. sativa]|uniref:Uncharacterized protein n=1 Tax=Eruca vesicaria subsp. sativa TaxID=29727 RepID=A0ABC8JJV8_ERUVS|nr:unnamed protein product [Eruca vesicaria subsp. sativa]
MLSTALLNFIQGKKPWKAFHMATMFKAEVANLFADLSVLLISSLLTKRNQSICFAIPPGDSIEVFMDVPLSIYISVHEVGKSKVSREFDYP